MQTSYLTEPPMGLPGQKYGTAHNESVVTRVVEADMMFGVGVAKGSATGKVKVPAAAGDTAATFAGVTVADLDHNPRALDGKADGISIPSGDVASIAEAGKVYVIVEEDVLQGDPAYLRHTANGAGKLLLGAFRKTAEASVGLVKGAKFDGDSFSVVIGATTFKVAPLRFDSTVAAS